MSAPIDAIAAVLNRIATIEAKINPKAAAISTAALDASSAGNEGGLTSSSVDFSATLARMKSGSLTNSVGDGRSSGAVTGSDVVNSAKKYLGIPYVFGGTATSGLDCSGLVQKAYGDLGISLPRLSWDQAKTGTAVDGLANAKPGDILGFGTPAHHVAIYLGDNQMIAAPQPGENVKVQAVYETPASIRRVVSDSPAQGGVATISPSAQSPVAATGAGISSAVQQYSALFSKGEAQFGLPNGLLAAVAQTESGGNAAAVSPAGAQGLMQLMPTIAKGLNVDPWDPAQSVQGASKLLSGYLSKYQSVPLALAAYNAGPGAVDQFGGVPPYTETQNYVSKIVSLMAGASS